MWKDNSQTISFKNIPKINTISHIAFLQSNSLANAAAFLIHLLRRLRLAPGRRLFPLFLSVRLLLFSALYSAVRLAERLVAEPRERECTGPAGLSMTPW